jgi:DNA invertase Pin-like site-specific DNA recombinase
MAPLFAALAEKERSMISKRTKAALAAARQRGVELGNPKIALSENAAQKLERALSRICSKRMGKLIAAR